MFYPRAPKTLALLGVVALLVAESHSFNTQHATQQIINNDFGAAQLALSIVINQMALLRILNESSTFSSLPTTRHKTYRFYEYPATPPQALQACEQLGGRLALPTNEEEEKQVTKLIGVSFGSKVWPYAVYWISGTDQQEEGNWIDSVTGQPLRYTNFESGQPDNAGGREHCLHKTSVFPGWNDIPCDVTGNGYVCEFKDE